MILTHSMKRCFKRAAKMKTRRMMGRGWKISTE
jgi:hypothetical protein